MHNSSRTIFIGDVHGCFVELCELINKIKLNASDRVILLGDLVNKGPRSAAVVNYVKNQGFEAILGNHDYEYIQGSNQNPKFKEIYQEMGREAHMWFSQLPFYIEDEHFIAVHGGIIPGLPISQIDPYILMNIRTWDGKGKDLSNPKNPPWYELYTGKKPVFYGHWARKGLNLRKNTYGLDSGCVYGNSLSAYILEEHKLIQVEATQHDNV